MGLVVVIVCALFVVVPLIILAAIARATVGRVGRMLSRTQPLQDGVNTLSSQLNTLMDTMSGIRSRGRAAEVGQ